MAMTYEEAVRYLDHIPEISKKTTADNLKKILNHLKVPQDSFQVIHVAGTNGKGSVCAFITSMLKDMGYRTGTFTSPHLVDVTERFQINGEEIQRETFLTYFIRLYRIFHGEKTVETPEGTLIHPSYFEFLFLMGMMIFKDASVDYGVIEAGMGGRRDATNMLEKPSLCVITSISLDHTEYLGDTVEKIAEEKAGIIKEGVPVAFDASSLEASRVIREQAGRMHAPFRAVTRDDWSAQVSRNGNVSVRFSRLDGEEAALLLPFKGTYQGANAALAASALELLFGRKVSVEAMEKTRWEARMEEILPGVYLDGAHNGDGIRAFLESASCLDKGGRRLLLFSSVAEKDYRTMAEEIEGYEALFSKIYLTSLKSSRGAKTENLAASFLRAGDLPVEVCGNAKEAFLQALSEKGKKDLLFIAGSLYLAGEIKEILKKHQV